MPIKRLARTTGAFPQIGILRKGAPSVEKTNRDGKKYNTFGADLEYFRFDTDDGEAADRFVEFYGNEPRRINVFLPFPTMAENFECWQEAWSAGALQHRCDGDTCVRWLDKATQMYRTDPIDCPHRDLDKHAKNRCKPVGRLKVVIPELRRLAYVMALTTSEWDILTIQDNLMALEARHGSLQGIPMILSRVPREISTPRENGPRTRVTKWLLQIEAAPRWVDLQLQAMERAALPVGATPLALPAPSDEMIIDSDDTDYAAAVEEYVADMSTVDLPPIREITTHAPEKMTEADRLQRDLKALRDAERAINLEPAPFKWNAKQGVAPLKAAIETSRATLIGYVPGMLDTLEGMVDGDALPDLEKKRELNTEMLNHADLIELVSSLYSQMQEAAASAVAESYQDEQETNAALEPAL